MADREPELEQNPYMSSFYKNPPAPVSRPINTNRGPNPYDPDRGTRHLRDQSRLGTYSLHSELDMVLLGKRASSDLVAAAIGSPPFQKSRPRASPLGGIHRAHNASYYEPAQISSKSNKRRYVHRESSSELSEHEDDDVSPATKHRLAPTPIKQRKIQASDEQRKTQRYRSDEEYHEQIRDDAEEPDEDAEEELALERLLARHAARKNTSPSYKTPAGKRRKQDAPTTPMDGMLYPTPTGNTSNTLKKKPKGKPVPQDLKTADAADRMMFRWKNAGRPWDEIRDEYYRLSGTKPAASSLSVRYIKLNENLATHGFKNEVALIKAVSDAKIKTSQTLWLEVVVQMKAITGDDFAAPSLRKRYEEIEKRHFFLSEQNPAKDGEWPQLPGVENGSRVLFQGMPELVPVVPGGSNMENHGYGQNGGNRSISKDMSTDSLFAERSMEDANDFGSITTANGRNRCAIFTNSKSKGADISSTSRFAAENENESPSHSHPQVRYGRIDYASGLTSEDSMSMSMIPGTPTPANTVGAALMETGVGCGLGASPRPGLVGYGYSDDSE